MADFKLISTDLHWTDSPNNIVTTLCAIGEYDDNDVRCLEIDDQVFFWFADENEIKQYMEDDELNEFKILSYKEV